MRTLLLFALTGFGVFGLPGTLVAASEDSSPVSPADAAREDGRETDRIRRQEADREAQDRRLRDQREQGGHDVEIPGRQWKRKRD